MTQPTPLPDDHLDVLVIGAGQAGLAVAAELRRHGLRFLVVDAGAELGHTWRSRWDSLRLFSPAQYDGLPGMAFPAPADTYPSKDEVADYLAAYAARFQLPVLLDCAVTRLERREGRFLVHTTQGTLRALQVVVATGPFQVPVVPALADGFDAGVTQLHSAAYRNPADLPDGPVLVVGGGNSGLQVAEELAATHDVVLATGAPVVQLPQRFLGRDLFWWMTATGLIRKSADSRLARRMRAKGELVIGTTYRSVARAGVTLRPRLVAASEEGATFEDGSTARPATVVWATGFRRDYGWIDIPGVVVDGEVVHRRGVTDVPGLSFIGLPWQHTRGSALLGFVQHDARWLAGEIAAARTTAAEAAQPERAVSE
ncbi:MAG TPA: FAD-dependent oxidoreductase [Marmoricola sp.]|nr:FAD-dependent oxidoreductase [Marmoricola sp.]